MVIKSLEIKTKSNYNWDDMVYFYNFDVNLVKVIKLESKIGANIYYIRYVLEPEENDNSMYPLYFVINRLFGYIEKIEGSSDTYLVVDMSKEKIINIFNKLWKFIENEITSSDSSNIIKKYNQLRFNSNVDLPLYTLIEFRMLTIVINCVIEKDGEYYPEIYLDECLVYTRKMTILRNVCAKQLVQKTYNIKMIKLGIKNRLFFHPAKLNNILDINLNKISASDILKNDDLAIY